MNLWINFFNQFFKMNQFIKINKTFIWDESHILFEKRNCDGWIDTETDRFFFFCCFVSGINQSVCYCDSIRHHANTHRDNHTCVSETWTYWCHCVNMDSIEVRNLMWMVCLVNLVNLSSEQMFVQINTIYAKIKVCIALHILKIFHIHQ